jgi:ubiquinone/menaquinone biosynthesis C-methylase UbiE
MGTLHREASRTLAECLPLRSNGYFVFREKGREESSMPSKPDFLGPQVASAFQDPSVVLAYQFRPTYPAEVFDLLAELVVDTPRCVLDAGCGTGLLARSLIERVDRLDAVDCSHLMIEQGKRLPQGNHPRLSWIVGQIEEVSLHPPYALITTGDSLHWMDWEVVMPRFAQVLSPHGCLAILRLEQLPVPWSGELSSICQHYTTVPSKQLSYDYLQEIEDRGLFQRVDVQLTKPVLMRQVLEDYIASFHGRASFSRDRMTAANAMAFDEEIRALVSPFCQEKKVELQIVTEIVWGKPLLLHAG